MVKSTMTVEYIRSLVEKGMVLAPDTARVLLSEIEKLREVLRTIKDMSQDDLQNGYGYRTNLHQIEANARAALGIPVRSEDQESIDQQVERLR